MNKFKQVTEEEFNQFIERKDLTRAVYAIVEPMQVQFNDFSDGKVWPQSVVAYFYDDYLDGDKRLFFVRGVADDAAN